MNGMYNPQMMAQALRQPMQPPAGGGMVGGQSSFNGAQLPTTQPKQGQSMVSPELAKAIMAKGKAMMSGPTGADIGQAAQQYGPEVAKMSGSPAAGGSMAGPAGALAGLALASYGVDKEMNENSGSMINADKLNSLGSYNGLGLRAGDLANGLNPATWASDPKKAGKGLANALTLGALDKFF